jgi:isopentenyl diphosphate isomerase/L-lactate dehydrogenase-like FMN-dependent dehydrogenase
MGRSTALNASVNWDDVRELRRLWPGKLIVKGIQTAPDAVLAADCGADAVVLSNHGGRVLDSSAAPILVLPEVVDAVRKRIAVIVDSGFRRGSHVVKALALGADAVMIGRAPLHGTATAGEAGARRALAIYREEIDRVMALLGCTRVSDLTREHLIVPSIEQALAL